MKITLISPYSDITAYGVRNISAFVKKEGFDAQMLFMSDKEFDSKAKSGSIYQYDENILRQVVELSAGSDLIGISLFTCHFDRAVQLTKYIKQSLKVPVMWGGIHPTIKPEESLNYCDIVCLAEGEEAVAELLHKMKNKEDYFNTKNLCFKKDGNIIKNPIRNIKEDLDSFPFPDYSTENHKILDNTLKKFIPLDKAAYERFFFSDPLSHKPAYMTMTTRGCPHKCSYCMSFRGLYDGQKYLRRRSPKHIIEELITIKKNFDFIEGIMISDDSFFVMPARDMKEFSELYKEKIALPFRCLGSPSTITEEKLSYLVDAGLYEMQMGIETASEQTKKLYNRHTSNDIVLGAAKIINKFNSKLVAIYDVILDNPYETKENIIETLEFLLKVPRPFHLQFFSLIFFPGTELYNKAKKDGIITDEGRDVYRKQFQFIQVRYLNLMFYLFNYGVPNSIIRFLLNKHMVNIFERESMNSVLSRVVSLIKAFKRTLRKR